MDDSKEMSFAGTCALRSCITMAVQYLASFSMKSLPTNAFGSGQVSVREAPWGSCGITLRISDFCSSVACEKTVGAGLVESASILRNPSSAVNFLSVCISWSLVTSFRPYPPPLFGIFDIALIAPSMHLSVNSVSTLYVTGLLLHTSLASAILPSTMDTAF